MVKLNNTFGFSKSLLDTIKLIGNSTQSVPVSTPKPIISEQRLDEVDKTYPFKANQLAPLVVQLRSILNFLSKSGVLGKMMRENRELFDVYVDSEITDTRLDEMIKFVDTLVEGRPKGSKNNKMPKSMSNSEKPKKSENPEEDDDEQDDAYSPASRSGGEHVMAHLWSASDLPSGGDIQTQKGSRKVSQDLAKQFLDHFVKLKPEQRANHSAFLFGSKVNPEITPEEKTTARLTKGLSPEVFDNKPGAGRPPKRTAG